MSNEDDTYSTMFTALKHPIRRKILRILSQQPTTYTEILNQLNIENGLLNYHLENMRDLLTKNEDSKYNLSEFGRAAVNLTEKVEEAPDRKTDTPQKLFGRRLNLKPIMAGIIALLIFSNVFLVYVYQSSQSEKTNALSIALIQASELNSIHDKLDNQNTMITRINSTVRTLTEANHNYTAILSSYGTQITNLQNENMRLARETSDIRDLTSSLGVPTQNGTILVKSMQFEEVDQAFSPVFTGPSPLFNNSSLGLTLSSLPESFMVNRTWSSADDYKDHTVGFVTWLKSGDIVCYKFNATNRIAFYLGLWNGSKFVSVDSAYSYGQTYRVPRTGVYVFNFAIPNVYFSESASVSFRCYELTNG